LSSIFLQFSQCITGTASTPAVIYATERRLIVIVLEGYAGWVAVVKKKSTIPYPAKIGAIHFIGYIR
jgi:hypothetical protein